MPTAVIEEPTTTTENQTPTTEDQTAAESAFLTHSSRIRTHAHFSLKHVRCPSTRDDLTAEIIAIAWKHFIRLATRGRRPELFVTTLTMRCSQAVRSGRRLVKSESSKDAMPPIAKVRRGFSVTRLGVPGRGLPESLAELLLVDPRARVDEQAALRVDFPRWRAGFKKRDRDVLDALAAGSRTDEVAETFGISPARVSQLRREFQQNWYAFHRGELG